MSRSPYYVKAKNGKGRERNMVIGYAIFKEGADESVAEFLNKDCGTWEISLSLANQYRDDCNAMAAGKEPAYNANKMFPFASRHRMTD